MAEDDPDNRFGGNYLKVKDETKPPLSCFYVMVTGNIMSAQMKEADGVSCVYEFKAGTDWH